MDHLTSQLANERARSVELGAGLDRRRQQQQLELQNGSIGIEEEERTVRSPVEGPPAGNVGVACGGGGAGGVQLVELSEQLKLFCSEAQRISFPM